MTDATLRRLTELAEAMSTGNRKVSPMQVAAQLLEEAVSRVDVKTPLRESEPNPAEKLPPKPIKIRPAHGGRPQEQGRKNDHRRKKA